jgi:hypothetical protein
MLYWDTGTSSAPADLDLGSKAKVDFDGMTLLAQSGR